VELPSHTSHANIRLKGLRKKCKPQSGQPRFQPKTFQIKSSNANHLSATLFTEIYCNTGLKYIDIKQVLRQTSLKTLQYVRIGLPNLHKLLNQETLCYTKFQLPVHSRPSYLQNLPRITYMFQTMHLLAHTQICRYAPFLTIGL
jgi:hypothetical protein